LLIFQTGASLTSGSGPGKADAAARSVALTSPPRRVFHLPSPRFGAKAQTLAMPFRMTKTTSKSLAATTGGVKG